eukprot:TRINITY_DN259_c1_g1_i2.p1 TRINITY_DN259_c1_g1~~TRINITY_DN259_c1_g1_i2.p1  ORF type:complete len:191 (-),score=20.45 TRINITY_DN259_c1_g1_i2:170-742(-)
MKHDSTPPSTSEDFDDWKFNKRRGQDHEDFWGMGDQGQQSWAGSGPYGGYKETKSSHRRERPRTIDDWIRDVERNARLRNARNKGKREQWKANEDFFARYHEKIKQEKNDFEKDYDKFESKAVRDIDAALNYSFIQDYYNDWDKMNFSQRCQFTLKIIYLMFIRWLLKYGAKVCFMVAIFLGLLESVSDY